MNEKKQNILIVVGLLVLVGMIGGIAYSFFNYTRTGTVNTVKTGGLTFSAEQDGLVTLDGLFPISGTNNITSETPGVGSLSIHVTGSTNYSFGIEYLVKAVNVTTPASGKELPISIAISYTANNNKTIGTLDNNYYTNRGHNTSLYKVLSTDTIEENGEIVVGYIAPGQEGIDGNITILAYLDADDIAITDTEGADPDWLQGRTVFTTEEWNALENEGVSFQIKIEAQEGVWTENTKTAFAKIKSNVNTTTTIDFSQASSSSNGEGLYQLNEASGNNYPIYYYRGAVTDNNVIFGGFCWQIVRTTETGGIKMVYNGIATGDGKTCENTTGASRQLATTYAFNTNYSSLSDVGYMYNKRYVGVSDTPTTDAYFGSSVSYNETSASYTLTGIYQNDNVTKAVKDNDHHYTCNSASSYECPSVRYYYYNNYYITLSEGETIEDAIYKMTGNGTQETKAKTINQNYKLNNTDSKAKNEIEKWFKTNLTNEEDESKINYQEYLEDTIFCNDRSFKTVTGNTSYETYSESGWNPNGGNLTKYISLGTWNRYQNNYYSTSNKPVLSCENITDRFSKSNPEATLKYSVGLLAIDEIILGGLGGNGNQMPTGNYLITGSVYWSLSPSYFGFNYAYEMGVNNFGTLGGYYVGNTFGLRPSVSLKLGTEFESGGEGTALKPYVVKIAE